MPGWKIIEGRSLSPGEAILIILALAVPLIGILYRRLRYRTLALSMELSIGAIPKGTTAISITIKARVPVAVERVNLRFVEKRWLGWLVRDAQPATIKITDFRALRMRSPPDPGQFRATPDGAGGFDGAFLWPKNWVGGDFWYMTIDVAGNKAWAGYLSLETVTTEQRLYVRRAFTVMADSYAP